MSLSQVATRYAKSLLDLAIELGKTEVVKNDMQVIKDALQNRDLYLLLKSPIINQGKKESAINAVFGNTLNEMTLQFINLSIKKGREGLLPEVIEEFQNQYNRHFKIAKVKVTSAVTLDETTISKIRSKVAELVGGDKTIQRETKIDASLIGGFVIQYEDKLFDSSIAYQLNKLKHSFEKN